MKQLLVVFCLVLLVPGCKRPDTTASQAGTATVATSGIQARVELDGEPQLGKLPLTVYLLADGTGVSGAEVEITGDMTHAGMVPVITNATETEAGLYRAEDFTFTMAGDWILTTDIKLPDGGTERVETLVTVPGN